MEKLPILKQLLKVFNFTRLIENFTNIDRKKGIMHRKAGNGLGTDKGFSKDDLQQLDTGLEKFVDKINEAREEIGEALKGD